MLQSDSLPIQIRSAAVLATSYDTPTVFGGPDSGINLSRYNQLQVYHKFTKGSLTTAELVIEFSPNGTDWYSETASSISSGTDTNAPLVHQVSATGNYRYSVPLKDAYVRVRVKGTGTVTSSSSQIDGMLGVV